MPLRSGICEGLEQGALLNAEVMSARYTTIAEAVSKSTSIAALDFRVKITEAATTQLQG